MGKRKVEKSEPRKEINDIFETIDKAEEIQVVEKKPSKKLLALGMQLDDRLGELDRFLKQQGLGQNARKKVVDLINEINVVRDDIEKESEK